jgi:hypothetical protein
MFGQVGTTSYADVLDVAKSVDFLSIHVYAYIDAPWSWDWKQLSVPEGPERATAMMNAAMAYTKSAVRNVKSALAMNKLDRPIMLGEAGWKSENSRTTDKDATFRAHPVNQKIFYDALMSWVYGGAKDSSSPRGVFYFEAFDEPWKSEDDNWGLFDVDRRAKYVLWDAFPDLKPADAPSYTESDAVYYKLPPPVDAGSDEASSDDAIRPDGEDDVALPDDPFVDTSVLVPDASLDAGSGAGD